LKIDEIKLPFTGKLKPLDFLKPLSIIGIVKFFKWVVVVVRLVEGYRILWYVCEMRRPFVRGVFWLGEIDEELGKF